MSQILHWVVETCQTLNLNFSISSAHKFRLHKLSDLYWLRWNNPTSIMAKFSVKNYCVKMLKKMDNTHELSTSPIHALIHTWSSHQQERMTASCISSLPPGGRKIRWARIRCCDTLICELIEVPSTSILTGSKPKDSTIFLV